MRVAIVVVSSMVFAGCAVAPPQWAKAGGDQREKLECEMEAEKAAVSSDRNAMVASFEKADRRNKVMSLCMRSKGWALTRT